LKHFLGLILPNGTIKDLNNELTTTLKPDIEVDQANIETMMGSLFDNVIQQFDEKLPNILNELSSDLEEEDQEESTTINPILDDVEIKINFEDLGNDEKDEDVESAIKSATEVSIQVAEVSLTTLPTPATELITTTESTTTTTSASTSSSSETTATTTQISGTSWDYRTGKGMSKS